jgi:hypothetical protein
MENKAILQERPCVDCVTTSTVPISMVLFFTLTDYKALLGQRTIKLSSSHYHPGQPFALQCLSAVVLAMVVASPRAVGQNEILEPSTSMALTTSDSKEREHARRNWNKPTAQLRLLWVLCPLATKPPVHLCDLEVGCGRWPPPVHSTSDCSRLISNPIPTPQRLSLSASSSFFGRLSIV